jgi:threonyl-tRNA synthetase
VTGEITHTFVLFSDLRGLFVFKFDFELSARSAKSIFTDVDCEMSTNALKSSPVAFGFSYEINESEDFYGLK